MWSVATNVLLSAACDEKPAAPPASRVDAIQVKSTADQAYAELCDVYGPKLQALPPFSFPKLATSERLAQPATWHWVNVWATWCKPCVEELALVQRWQKAWQAQGIDVALTLLSVDADDLTVRNFRQQHPEVNDSARVADPNALSAWLPRLGLQSDASIPIHIFVGKTGRLQCVRAGAIDSSHKIALEKILRNPAGRV